MLLLCRSRLLADGLGKVSDSACFKLLFMRQLLLTGYHFDTESYQRIQVPYLSICYIIIAIEQCCGSGSVCFWASGILLLSSINGKKKLGLYCFGNDVNVASKSNKQKIIFTVVAILKVTDENVRIRIRSWVRIC
jgi:hypothetical protein